MPGELDRDLISNIISASSAAEAWVALRRALKPTGFDNLLYGTNRLRGIGVFGEKSNTYFLSDLPEDFMTLFWDNELYRTVPVAIWSMKNQGTISLEHGSNLYHAGKLPPDQHKTQKILADAGVTSGYSISFNPPDTPVAAALVLLNFGRSQESADDIWKRNGANIETYSHIFNLRMSSLPVPAPRRVLTSRQTEVLQWVGKGKTTAEIATILGLSPATIEKHLRQAREALGVSTTTQAVLHAQINTQIFTGIS